MNIKDLENIFSLLKSSDVTEFELDHDGTHVKLSRGKQQVISTVASATTHVEPAIVGNHINGQFGSHAAPAATLQSADVSHLTKVESPIVGTFYRKPSPDADVFVKEGDIVKKGETLCIIEAMKLMNEIESPCSGKIEKVLLSDGKVVEFGEILFLINPNA